MRAIVLKMSTVLKITHDKERWEIETRSSVLHRTVNFKVGQEFADCSREARVRARVEDAGLVMVHISRHGEEVREYFINGDGDLVQVIRLTLKGIWVRSI